MKILVTGGYGQLGRSISKIIKSKTEIFWTARNVPTGKNGLCLNILDKINLGALINLLKPDIIINLAALTNVDICEKKPVLAREINTKGVENICDIFNGKIIQISTDYVFDGKKGPYSESDKVSPLSIYGSTKLEAEKLVMSHNPENLVLRGNVLYDHNTHSKASFLDWVVDSLFDKIPINVVNDQINNPTWSQSMAKIIMLSIDKGISGIYHWGDAEFISRYDFALKIGRKFKLDTNLIKPISTKELGQFAPRPLKSGLKSNKILQILDIHQPSIDECLNKIMLK